MGTFCFTARVPQINVRHGEALALAGQIMLALDQNPVLREPMIAVTSQHGEAVDYHLKSHVICDPTQQLSVYLAHEACCEQWCDILEAAGADSILDTSRMTVCE